MRIVCSGSCADAVVDILAMHPDCFVKQRRCEKYQDYGYLGGADCAECVINELEWDISYRIEEPMVRIECENQTEADRFIDEYPDTRCIYTGDYEPSPFCPFAEGERDCVECVRTRVVKVMEDSHDKS